VFGVPSENKIIKGESDEGSWTKTPSTNNKKKKTKYSLGASILFY